MKFRFPYEKLLDHRKLNEEVARKNYLLARAQVDEAERELRDMYDEISASRLEAGRLEVQGGSPGPALRMIAEFIEGQKIRIERQRTRIRELILVVEQRHEAVIIAAREHQTLVKLKQKRWEDHRRLERKRELKEVDEIVTTRFKRESA